MEALFNYQQDHFTENSDKSEAPYYVPSCMDERRNISLFQRGQRDHKKRQDTLTQVNMSPRREQSNNNQSVDGIYAAAFDINKTTGSE